MRFSLRPPDAPRDPLRRGVSHLTPRRSQRRPTPFLGTLLAAALALGLSAAAPGETSVPLPASPARSTAPGDFPGRDKVDAWVLTRTAGDAEFLVFLSEQADLEEARALPTKAEKGRYVFERLREVARRTQGPVLSLLSAEGAEHRAFWIANVVWVRGKSALVRALAARSDVGRIEANPAVRFRGPIPVKRPAGADSAAAVGANLTKIRAPEVWTAGFTGAGVVIGVADTGVEWAHPALQGKYRGWNGATADHNYNWHDAIHTAGASDCGADSPEPCDDTGHGTGVTGISVGDDGAGKQIGVAPDASWIGCRNMNENVGSPATYTECFQWFIAPTDSGGGNPDLSKAPDVVNNSWSCPDSEGCTDSNVLKTIVENVRAAGIAVVAAASNEGPSCATVDTPPGTYDASFTVGATDNDDVIASFSSRGPVLVDESWRLKPDVTAPGVSVETSAPGGGFTTGFSGTSAAAPHVAGVTALLLSAVPALSGNVDGIERAIRESAVPLTTGENCGNIPGSTVPNNTFGHGRVDAYAAAFCPPPVVSAPISTAPATPGNTADVPSGTGHIYTWTLTGGSITGGQGTNQVTFTSGAAGTTMTLRITDSIAGCVSQIAARVIPVDFLDVPPSHLFHDFVAAVSRNKVTAGCGGGNYCPNQSVTRAQMAVFLLKAKHSAAFVPPPATGAVFDDVSAGSFGAAWIEQLFAEGITAGCDPNSYCPNNPVTRAQMAVFLLKSKHGPSFTPPPATGIFADVPPGNPFAPWIEQLFNEGITAGCGGGKYCPNQPNTRGQMAVFLTKTFDLP